MSKITFRADDDLVSRLEEYDASKSEVMRRALRAYVEGGADAERTAADETTGEPLGGAESIDAYLHQRIDTLVEERLDELLGDRYRPAASQPREVNVSVTVDGDRRARGTERPPTGEQSPTGDPSPGGDHSTPADDDQSASDTVDDRTSDDPKGQPEDPVDARKRCNQCGEALPQSAVYCSNCGEKAAHRVFCDCGDELRSDWGFCPGCGRRTPAADVLDSS